ncbi:hypothetical protein M514_02157 [Trichuris suis]|uniref:Spliceosome-associated protein CWC27 homolog n=1 Tax=Trichuris suis TaxID=68888 RepID=A0A085MI54_9BILA|nr:hypothetical protein M513_02157 [Trichuris suis]KFD66137.1 hypothetical protein M514_02157 [Trichuris suis]KHJ47354.1 peptidyl-prolyl cis-trans isomerase, cyclophilin-type [Trichuris suis]
MSEVCINEPATNGKVCLKTTVGDIEIELWSKECPKACRNFVTLCITGYYNNTIFHRVEPGFIVQGGDPTGTGCGGESAFGEPFKDEFHSRLRFSRRGLVAMASAGKRHTNGSQFFFTLGRTPELQNKHTIFGKVNKATLVNMLRLEECQVDKQSRPLYPEKILSCKVISNPFNDIVLPSVAVASKAIEEKPKKEVKQRNLALLSFGDEAKEEEEALEVVNKKLFLRGKSAHDVIPDNRRLSSKPVLSARELNRVRGDLEAAMYAGNESEKKKLDDAISNRLRLLTGAKSKLEEDVASDGEDLEDLLNEKEREQKKARLEKVKEEYRALRKELVRGSDVGGGDDDSNKKILKPAVAEYMAERNKYKNVSAAARGTTDRERETLKILEKFQSRLKAANQVVIERSKKPDDNDKDDGPVEAWMTHKFVAPVLEPEVKGSRPQDKDMFKIEDMRVSTAAAEMATTSKVEKRGVSDS